MSVYYYPGCSLHATASEYDRSANMVLGELGCDLVQVPDWTCCGATSAHSIDGYLAKTLPARTLVRAMAADEDDETVVVAPCAACFNRLARAAIDLQCAEFRSDLERVLEVRIEGEVRVLSLVQYLCDVFRGDVVTRELTGLNVACYYGCLLVRPPEVTGHKYPEQPRDIDQLVSLTRAEPVEWSYRTDCCGANLGLIDAGPVEGRANVISAGARDAGADALVTACPLCQANLEMRTKKELKLPSFYITELLALGMGLADSKLWRKHLIDPAPLLKRLNLG